MEIIKYTAYSGYLLSKNIVIKSYECTKAISNYGIKMTTASFNKGEELSLFCKKVVHVYNKIKIERENEQKFGQLNNFLHNENLGKDLKPGKSEFIIYNLVFALDCYFRFRAFCTKILILLVIYFNFG